MLTEKTCQYCHNTKPIAQFYKAKGNLDGYNNRCKPCLAEISKDKRDDALQVKWNKVNKGLLLLQEQRWRSSESGLVSRRKTRNKYREKYPIQRKAWKAVERAVLRGDLPSIKERKCISCGNVADHYHHHNGYEEKYRLDVVPVCAFHHKELEIL